MKLLNIKKQYGDKIIFDNLNITFDKPNYTYCIIGKSGAGKTTLFQILFGLDFDYAGDYFFEETNVQNLKNTDWYNIRSHKMQIVFQDYKLLDSFSVLDNIYFALANQNVDSQYIDELLDLMDLKALKNQRVNKLSGGEKQRLALVRALANKPKYILLDEPTGNLDDNNTKLVMDNIKKIKSIGVTVIIITHDSRVTPFCDEVYEIVNHTLKLKSKPKIEYRYMTYVEKEEKTNRSPLNYTLKSLTNNIKDKLLENIPVIIIFFVFILGFSYGYNENVISLANFYAGVSEKAIFINANNYRQQYLDELGSIRYVIDDGVRIAFSLEDLKQVSNIDGVKKARLFNAENVSLYDYDGNALSEIIKKK